MTVYLGDKAVGVNTIVEKELAKTKFGASVDSFLGDVDANGVYVEPTEPFILDLTGVKSVEERAFFNTFSYNHAIKNFIANDLTSVTKNAFQQTCFASFLEKAHFDNIEEIAANNVFDSFVEYSIYFSELSFKRLRKAIGEGVFAHVAYNTSQSKQYIDKIFPSLEEVGGSQCLYGVINKTILRYSKLKKITGSTAAYNPTFGSYVVEYFLPRVTEMSGYVFYSTIKKVHFAAQNQATIEALPDYANKFGGTSATVYFDLMLQITVNGVVYEREHTIDGYTSWKDANDNLVYTDETEEPAVGTVVYSDQGITQVGTVEGVA